jgi:hypothetical protein
MISENIKRDFILDQLYALAKNKLEQNGWLLCKTRW